MQPGSTLSRTEEMGVAMKKPRSRWLRQRREQVELLRERTGDSPEQRAERRKAHEATVKDAASRAGRAVPWVGF
jgi:hypothetical protein